MTKFTTNKKKKKNKIKSKKKKKKNKQSGNKCPVSARCHTKPEAFEIMAHYTRIHPKGLNASVTENKTR